MNQASSFVVYVRKNVPDAENVLLSCSVLFCRPDFSSGLLFDQGVYSFVLANQISVLVRQFSFVANSFGLIGLFTSPFYTPMNLYLLHIGASVKAGNFFNLHYYTVKNVSVLPLVIYKSVNTSTPHDSLPTASSLDPSAQFNSCIPSLDSAFVNDLIKTYSLNCFYYGQTVRINKETNSFDLEFVDISAAQQKASPGFKGLDNSVVFLWNSGMRTFVHTPNLNCFMAYIICGSVTFHNFALPSVCPVYRAAKSIENIFGVEEAAEQVVSFVLVSRLSWQRTGARLDVRGVNDSGAVSNFVETEFILGDKNTTASYVQVRGSVPVFWSQHMVASQIEHQIRTKFSAPVSFNALVKHFDGLRMSYGNVKVVSLLRDQKQNNELTLKNIYKSLLNFYLTDTNDYFFVQIGDSFNSGTETQLNNTVNAWHRSLPHTNLFHLSNNCHVESEQKMVERAQQHYVVRTNCVDCLERSNYTQYVINANVLTHCIFPVFFDSSNQAQYEQMLTAFLTTLKQLYTKNHSNLCIMYAGTSTISANNLNIIEEDNHSDCESAFNSNPSLSTPVESNATSSSIKLGTLFKLKTKLLNKAAINVKRKVRKFFASESNRNSVIEMMSAINYGFIKLSVNYANSVKNLLPRKLLERTTVPVHIIERILDSKANYSRSTSLNVVVGTWNVNAALNKTPAATVFNVDDIQKWLLQKKDNFKFPDVIVVGLQEVIDLNAKKIISSSVVHSTSVGELATNNTNTHTTNNYSYTNLNLSQQLNSGSTNSFFDEGSSGNQRFDHLSEYMYVADDGIEANTNNMAYVWTSQLKRCIETATNCQYCVVEKIQLVGILLMVFVAVEHLPYVSDVDTDLVKTGFGGTVGNKGGVAVSCKLYNSTFCFVNAHLTAGSSASKCESRNADYQQIAKQLAFKTAKRTLFEHDYVFWCGDLNYRLEAPALGIKSAIYNSKDQARTVDGILAHDQLTREKSQNKIFANFKEAVIGFMPTYKYDVNTDFYDTSDKKRTPSYTDRILYWNAGLNYDADRSDNIFEIEEASEDLCATTTLTECLHYGRSLASPKFSDHRPVMASFRTAVTVVDEAELYNWYRTMVGMEGTVLKAAELCPASMEDSFFMCGQEDGANEAQLRSIASEILSNRVFPGVKSVSVTSNSVLVYFEKNVSVEMLLRNETSINGVIIKSRVLPSESYVDYDRKVLEALSKYAMKLPAMQQSRYSKLLNLMARYTTVSSPMSNAFSGMRRERSYYSTQEENIMSPLSTGYQQGEISLGRQQMLHQYSERSIRKPDSATSSQGQVIAPTRPPTRPPPRRQ